MYNNFVAVCGLPEEPQDPSAQCHVNSMHVEHSEISFKCVQAFSAMNHILTK